jgi:LAS superfamily LD-carboxypeptidase LdcB
VLLWASASLFLSAVPQAGETLSESSRVYLFAPACLHRGEKNSIAPTDITIQEGLLTVLKPPMESGGYTWLYIRDTRGNEGWIHEHLTSGEPEALAPGKTAAIGQERVDYYNALPHDYKPSDLVPLPMRYCRIRQIELRKEAADAFIELHEAAARAGLPIYGFSGYRSYAAQRELYLNRIKIGEKHRQRYVARPGHTEHQLGTVLDVVGNDVNFAAHNGFDRTPYAAWLRGECYRYGFVLSYGKDNTQPTGYAYESWHIRYIGRENALHWIRGHIAPDNPVYKKYILNSRS